MGREINLDNRFLTRLKKTWKKVFSHRKFIIACNICLGFIVAAAPPAMVVYHRWLDHPSFEYLFYSIWFYAPFLNRLLLPSYFLGIFFLFFLSIYIFGLLAIIDKVNLPDPKTENTEVRKPPFDIPAWQRTASKSLLVAGGICLVVETFVTILLKRIPTIDFLVIPLLIIGGLLLKETRLESIKPFLRKHAGWVIAYAAVYAALLVLLQFLFNEKEYQVNAGVIILLILVVIMVRWFRSIPAILWISLGALALYAWDLHPWHFYLFGDEFEFYKWASWITNSPIMEVCKNIFSARGAHLTHTYLVSLFQAGFMKIFGAGNFGWRISNPVILSAAVVCFYLFFRKFTKQMTALLIAGLLACSSYLMNFGKFGYDNPQAFFMLGLTLWLAAEAVFSRRPVLYALLGLAMGFCLYSYPAALYILPLPLLLMALMDLPKTKPAVWRWVCCLGMVGILAIPFIFQPAYFEGKAGGLFTNYPDSIARNGLLFIFGSNLIYSFFSYLYIVCETHFIASSHIDPFSAIWIPAGLVWITAQVKRNKFALFWILSFLIMWFLAGASHGREYPPDTRMLFLLPWWCSFTAFGITWLVEWVGRKAKSKFWRKVLPIVLMVVIAATNLVQVYWLVPRRYIGNSSMQSLFLRLAQRGVNDPGNIQPTYLFVTDEHWLLDEIRMLQGVYQVPVSAAQLERIVMTDETPEPDQLGRLLAADTIIIPQPWMESNLLMALRTTMVGTDKVICYIRESPDSEIRFTAYYPADLTYLCPVDGHWVE